MALGENHDESLFVQGFAIQVQLINRGTQETNVNLLPAQSLVLKTGKNVAAFDFDRGKSPAMLEHDFADDAAQSRRQANSHRTGSAFLSVAGNVSSMTSLYDELARFFEKGMAGIGQFDFAFIANKQRDSEIVFQLTDLPAEGRLGQM